MDGFMINHDSGSAGAIGIAGYLSYITNMLDGIKERESNPENRKIIYSRLLERLDADARMIEELTASSLNDEDSPDTAEKFAWAEERFINASDCFLAAIDYIEEFTQTEDDSIIKDVRDIIAEGSDYLRQAEVVADQIQDEDCDDMEIN